MAAAGGFPPFLGERLRGSHTVSRLPLKGRFLRLCCMCVFFCAALLTILFWGSAAHKAFAGTVAKREWPLFLLYFSYSRLCFVNICRVVLYAACVSFKFLVFICPEIIHCVHTSRLLHRLWKLEKEGIKSLRVFFCAKSLVFNI